MKSERILKWLAIAAIAFGALTVFSGGRALFGGMEARAELGNDLRHIDQRCADDRQFRHHIEVVDMDMDADAEQ